MRKAFWRIGFVAVVLVMGILVLSLSTASAKKITLKISTVQLPQQQMGKAILKFKEIVDKQLPDKVDVKAYTSAQLYNDSEELEALTRGQLEMALPIGSKLETIDPSLQVFKLPFLFPDIQTAYTLLDSPFGEKLFEKLKTKDLQVIGTFSSGNVIISNNKHPLKMPEDFKGLKIRSFGRMGKSTLEALGAQAVVTPSSETFSALQQGVIDGASTPNSVFLLRKYNTIQKYATDGGMMNFTDGIWLVNEKFWKKLPDDVRGSLDKIIKNIVADMRDEMEKDNNKIIEDIAAAGTETHVLTPEETAAWKEALQPVYTEFREEIGPELIDTMLKRVSKPKP